MVKVSVIVPMFNASRYINECISSIQRQSLEDIEIICVNDGSTDDSLEQVLAMAKTDTRIQVIDKRNTGYGHSVNEGIKKASGRYIGIVESDDFIASNMYESLFAVAEQHAVEVVMSDYYRVKTGEVENRTYMKAYSRCAYNTVINPSTNQHIFLGTGIWTGIYKRSFLLEKEIWLNETPGASYQDTSFLFKVWAFAERCYLYDDAFVYYRTDNVDSSVHSSKKVFCVCDEFAEIERFLDTAKKKQLLAILQAKKFIVYNWNYNRLISVYQYAFLLKMHEELSKGHLENNSDNESVYLFLSSQQKNDYIEIIYNMDEYFEKTSKELKNDKLNLSSGLSPKLNRLAYKEGSLKLLRKYDQIIIYGAGKISERLSGFLIKNDVYDKVIGYAVSTLENNRHEIDGKAVKIIDEYNELTNQALVLIAVNDRYQLEIYTKLMHRKFCHVFLVNSEVLTSINI